MKKEETGLIELEDMEFYAFHGCFKEERLVGCRFLVNASIEADYSLAAETDNIADAVDYTTVYDTIKGQMMQPPINLLEHLAKLIIDAIYLRFPYLQRVTIKISKNNPPIRGQMRHVSVTLTKQQK